MHNLNPIILSIFPACAMRSSG